MVHLPLALFGTANQGSLGKGELCTSLLDLYHHFGSPPKQASGLFFALQAILYQKPVLFFRIEENKDALFLLRNHSLSSTPTSALFLPDLTDALVLEESKLLCLKTKRPLLLHATDFYNWCHI